jgi:uncharacterized protein (DUF1810 family)
MADPFKLDRFVTAQDEVQDRPRAELAQGKKQTHWMWFIFPQIAGLGQSAMSKTYAISGAAEAQAYLAHPTLGPSLRELTELLCTLQGHSAEQVFGQVDAAKFRSCMTLFAEISGEPVFKNALQKYFAGQPDLETLSRLS